MKNRAIKFRAYAPYENMMMDVKQIDWLSSNECQLSKNTTDRLIYMQYTGFTDINGDDIFEGDIISDYVAADQGFVQSFQQVYWCNEKGAWMIDGSYNQDKTFSSYLSEDLAQFEYKVVGNIYQNKSLIQK